MPDVVKVSAGSVQIERAGQEVDPEVRAGAGVEEVLHLLIGLVAGDRRVEVEADQPRRPLQPVEPVAKHRLVVTAGGQRPEHVRVTGAPGPHQHGDCAQQQL